MRRKAIVREFVFKLKVTEDNRLVSSIIPKREKQECYVIKRIYNGGHNDGAFCYDAPCRFFSGKSIKDIYSNIVDKFKWEYDFVNYLEKKISSDIEDLIQEEIDKYFFIAQLNLFFNTMEYNIRSKTATFSFMTLYKFVDDEVQSDLMKYAKDKLNTDEFNTFVEITKEVW